MLSLAMKTLRARKGAFAAAFLTLLVASTLITACGLLLQTGIAGGVPTERYRGTEVVVTADQSFHTEKPKKDRFEPDTPDSPDQLKERIRLDPALAAKLAAVPGVRAVVPDVSFPVTLGKQTPGAPVLGHGWDSAQLTPFELKSGKAPQRPNEIVVGQRAGLKVGDTVDVQVNDAPAPYRVSGVAEPSGGEFAKQATVFFTPDRATELAATGGRVDAFGVLAKPGTSVDALQESLEKALPAHGFEVRTGTDRGAGEFIDDGNALALLLALAGSFGGIALMIAVFVVSSTLALSVQQRQREMALLRAIGTTPRQLRQMVSGEAFVLGLLAAVVGCLPGFPVGKWLLEMFQGFGMVPREVELVNGPLPAVAVVSALVVAAVLAGLSAVRRAAKIRPTEALGDAATGRTLIGKGRLFTGLVLAAGSVALLIASAFLSGVAAAGAASGVAILLIIAIAVLGPVVAKVIAFLAAPLMRRYRVGGYLASANSTTNVGRLAGSIVPLVLAIGFGCVAMFVQTTQVRVAEESGKTSITADYVLTAPQGIPASVPAEIAAVPGVSSVTSLRQTQLKEELPPGTESMNDAIDTMVVSPGDLGKTLDLRPSQGDLTKVRGNDIAVSAATASSLDVSLGGSVKLRLGDATLVEVRVVSIFEREQGLGKIVVDRALVAGHTNSQRDDQVLIKADASALPVLKAQFPDLVVADGASVEAARTGALRANMWINLLVVGIIMLYTGIAVVNTLVMATGARRREFALLRLVGATRKQVLRTTRWESALVVVSSIILGSAVAAATLVPISIALSGSPMPYVPPALYFGLIGIVTVLGLAATEIPARLALRLKPVEAIGIKE
ncbi:putative ABC transport system permease protein [Amycolatopsis xylanica]|uniref:Putative ABC transport system permease protein n=1 Tax=Amycolatopsis xylanica TaxID=589385 RepID=A0A1H3GZT8_9PSEU|nr:FtsX-like permease family protein [Amycolatopsis xylanica]SDY08843.1 putative ABC transport system permease protein [Amycolatopsis xylanica]